MRQKLLWLSAAAESGMTDEEFWAYQLPALETAMAPDRFPTIALLSDDAFDGTADDSFNQELQLILDGLDAQLARRAPERKGPHDALAAS